MGRARRDPLLRGGRCPVGRPHSLDVVTSRACRVVYFTRSVVPARERSIAWRDSVDGGGPGGQDRADHSRAVRGSSADDRVISELLRATDIDAQRNRRFFRRFLAPSEDGMLLGAEQGDELVGYACLYWHLHLAGSGRDGVMNDLFVKAGGPRSRRRPRTDRGERRRGPRARRRHLEWVYRRRQPAPPSASMTQLGRRNRAGSQPRSTSSSPAAGP